MEPDEEIENEDEAIVTQDDAQSNVETVEEKDTKAKPGESVRESLRRALKEVEPEDESEPSEPETETTEVKEAPAKEAKEKPEVKAKPVVSVPAGWTKEAKAEWDKLPQSVKDSVAKREQEASSGFKDYGEKTKKLEEQTKTFEELDNVFKPREQELQRIGVSKAQVVNQMFQWIDALSNSNKNYAKTQLIQLGKNYGIELEVKPVAQQQEIKTPAVGADNQQTEIPAELKTFIDGVTGKVTTLETELTGFKQKQIADQQKAANDYLANWAKDKPHLQAVRTAMFGLLNSGAIPLKADGSLDLDSAYDQAVNANPVTRELVRKEEAEKTEALAKVEREKKELARLKQVNKAKAAATSISTKAPTGSSVANAGKNGKPPSVRDSLKQAITEVRDNN